MAKHQFKAPVFGSALYRAIEHLKIHRGATIDELEKVMDCGKEHVASSLQRAINAGIVERGYYFTPVADKILKNK